MTSTVGTAASDSLSGVPYDTRNEVSLRHIVIGLLMAAEVLTYAFFDSPSVKGAAVGAILGGLAFGALAVWALGADARTHVRLTSFVGTGLVFSAVGVFGLLVAVLRHNNPYYIAADVYHFFFELLLGTVLLGWAIRGVTSERLKSWVALAGIGLGLLGIGLAMLGMAGFHLATGNEIGGSSLFRLDMGYGVPITPLLFVTAAAFPMRSASRSTRLRLWASLGLLLLVLFMTFKRTMWLAYIGALFLMRAPRRWVIGTVVFLSVIIVAALLFFYLYPHVVLGALAKLASGLTYNPSYTVEDTLQDRIFQYIGLLPYIQRNPFGYGFGAEFSTFVPSLHRYDTTHYVHNYYLYEILQVGIPGLVVMLACWAFLMWKLWRARDIPSPWQWAVRGAFGATAVLAVSGMTLVSTHTLFSGFAIAMGIYALKQTPMRVAESATG